jgi:hypothetical protein
MRPSFLIPLFAAALAATALPVSANGPTDRLAALKAAEDTVAAQRKALDNPALADAARQSLRQQLAGPMQTLGTLQSFAGAHDEAVATFDAIGPMLGATAGAPAAPSPAIAWAASREAVAGIIEQARSRQIVILNEAHHVPVHRAFAMQLARELRKIGYTYLAVEALSEAPLAKGYLSGSSGYYVNEPAFANFLRDAQQQKWTLVPYEFKFDDLGLNAGDRINGRELGQVDNLVKRILANDPKGKIFIYAGYDHVREKAVAGDTWMAAYLRERTGIDPLTIDQSQMFAHPGNGSHPLYAQMAAKDKSGKPFMLARVGVPEVAGKYKGEVDMQVIHPPYPIVPATGRPQWMTSLAGLTPRSIPSGLWPATGRRLIEVRRKGAPADEVPFDAVLAVAGQKPPMMMVPAGVDVEFSASE